MDIKKISHIGIATENLEEAKKLYRDVLNLEFLGEEEVKDQKVKIAMFRAGEVRIELLEPASEDSPVRKFIEKNGPGVHHIAFEVPHIEETIEEVKNKGLKMIDEVPRTGAGNCKIAFIHPKSTEKVLMEICSHNN
jgi:methylmalonyl-CoA epimerase